MAKLENIDDDLDKHEIPFVKIDGIVEDFEITSTPSVVFFYKGIPINYPDLNDNFDAHKLLIWVLKNAHVIRDSSEERTPENGFREFVIENLKEGKELIHLDSREFPKLILFTDSAEEKPLIYEGDMSSQNNLISWIDDNYKKK